MSASALGGGGGERRYSVPSNPLLQDPRGMHSEDLHAWSIYRQNLNSDFTDSALGSTDKSPLPYGNFQLRDTTVQSILAHPRYGPKSALGSNMYTYLKFGLPRVFPPNHNGSQRSGTPRPKTSIGSGMKPAPRVHRASRGLRETSSGYDSSDNETVNYKNSRKYRSDPDFRMQNLHQSYQPGTGMPVVALQAAGVRASPHWNGARNKSVSEANLLGIDARSPRHPPPASHRRDRDRSPDTDHQSYLMPTSHIGSRISKAGSHLSLAQSRKQSTLRPGTDYVDGHASYIYPNYYVNHLEITSPENRSTLLVSGLSFEVKCGEVLGVLATSQHEATGLLDVLAGVKKKLAGDIVVNGQPVSARTLRRLVGYVRAEPAGAAPCPHLTVQHTLALHAALRCSRARTKHHASTSDMINLVVEELGLEQVRDTAVGRLTRSERRRLDVACQLLLEPAVLLLDQPTLHMDIFDTFFLAEYLRGWAAGGRAVILSLHPPTYEIFAMLSKVVLTSAGRTMYSGYRRDMLPYFASIDYPCPAFKNPSDYYLDLVTLDDLSAAAMLESSARIEALAGVFAATRARDPPPDPPPPVPLPAPLRSPNPFAQAFALFKKSLWYMQMYTMMNLISRLIVAAILSLVMGAIYWDLPTTDNKLTQGDRVGFHYAVMCVGVWPLLLLSIREVCVARRYAERDIQLGLYSRTLYVLVDNFMSLFSSCIVWLAYLVPSYAMSGLYPRPKDEQNGFLFYLGYSLVYLLTVECVVRAAAYVTGRQRCAGALSGALLLCAAAASGALLHAADLPRYAAWAPDASPSRWALPEFLRRELAEGALRASSPEQSCINKSSPLIDIIMQCPVPDGSRALATYAYARGSRLWESTEESFAVALAVVFAASALVATLAFVCDCARYVRSHERRRRRGHYTQPNLP